MTDSDRVGQRYALLSPHLDARERRLFAPTEANGIGYGGIAAVARIIGMAPSTIGRGRRDLAEGVRLEAGRIRRAGGGRKSLVTTDPGLVPALLALVEPTERGDPMSPLRWTCKSLRHLAAELSAQGHPVSRTVVAASHVRISTANGTTPFIQPINQIVRLIPDGPLARGVWAWRCRRGLQIASPGVSSSGQNETHADIEDHRG